VFTFSIFYSFSYLLDQHSFCMSSFFNKKWTYFLSLELITQYSRAWHLGLQSTWNEVKLEGLAHCLRIKVFLTFPISPPNYIEMLSPKFFHLTEESSSKRNIIILDSPQRRPEDLHHASPDHLYIFSSEGFYLRNSICVLRQSLLTVSSPNHLPSLSRRNFSPVYCLFFRPIQLP
jgi:hypothetical protein